MAGSEHTYVVVDLVEDGAGMLVKSPTRAARTGRSVFSSWAGSRLRQTNRVGEPGAWLQPAPRAQDGVTL
jgi:hypothetical protein